MPDTLRERIAQQLMDVRPEQIAAVYRIFEQAVREERDDAQEQAGIVWRRQSAEKDARLADLRQAALRLLRKLDTIADDYKGSERGFAREYAEVLRSTQEQG